MKKIILSIAFIVTSLVALSQNNQLPQTISIYIPNAFTPDGDGVNDIFTPSIAGHKLEEMYVYSRSGELVSHTLNEIGWDGKLNGNNCSEGIYIYILIITDVLDVNHQFIGTITLLKFK
jgi:gliding motility-associated-like protein